MMMMMMMREIVLSIVLCVFVAFIFKTKRSRKRQRYYHNNKTESDFEEEEDFEPSQSQPKGNLTTAELSQFDGRKDSKKPILLAVKGRIFDVTRGRDFYGDGGPYNCFAGRDCSLAFAKVSTKEEHMNADCENLYAMEIDCLNDWVRRLEEKYPEIGKVTDSLYKPPNKKKTKTNEH